jgi:MFS family permease
MVGLLFAGSTMLTPLYAIYQQAFGFPQIELTLIYATYVVGNLAALLLFGGISDRVGRRKTAIPAMAIGIVSAMVFMAATSVVLLYLARMLSGLAVGIGVGAATAWMSETLEGNGTDASVITTTANFIGLGLGALIAGALAEYAPSPLHLPFVVYVVAMAGAALSLMLVPETVEPPKAGTSLLRFSRIGVPADIRAAFVTPAIAGFGAMALVGFYAALMPGILSRDLDVTNHAVAGVMFFEIAAAAAISIVVSKGMSSRTSMLMGLASMIPGVIILVIAQIAGSLVLLIIATAVCGVAAALAYRGSMAVMNDIAPEERRGEVASAYFIACFCGNALPVVGIGVIATFASANTASVTFACMIVVFTAVALVSGRRRASA